MKNGGRTTNSSADDNSVLYFVSAFDSQNQGLHRFSFQRPDNLFCNPPSECLARRCVDPIGECNNHIEIIVFDNVPASITHYTLLCPHLAFIQFALGEYLFDMPFHTCSRNVKYRRDFFSRHPYRPIRRQCNRNTGGFYDNGSSFHSCSSNAIFSIFSNCPASACMSRPILSLVMRA